MDKNCFKQDTQTFILHATVKFMLNQCSCGTVGTHCLISSESSCFFKPFVIQVNLPYPLPGLALLGRVLRRSSCWKTTMPSTCRPLCSAPWWAGSTGLRGTRSTTLSSQCPSCWFTACTTSLFPLKRTSAWRRWVGLFNPQSPRVKLGNCSYQRHCCHSVP